LAFVNNRISWPSDERPTGSTARALGFVIQPVPTPITAIASPRQPSMQAHGGTDAASAAAQQRTLHIASTAGCHRRNFLFLKFVKNLIYLTFISLIFVIYKNNL
jgi:hypothetical protein